MSASKTAAQHHSLIIKKLQVCFSVAEVFVDTAVYSSIVDTTVYSSTVDTTVYSSIVDTTVYSSIVDTTVYSSFVDITVYSSIVLPTSRHVGLARQILGSVRFSYTSHCMPVWPGCHSSSMTETGQHMCLQIDLDGGISGSYCVLDIQLCWW